VKGFSDVGEDLRYGLRMLRKSPTFTAAALLSLALGIGANVAIFSIINALFLRPIAIEHIDRVVTIHTEDSKNPGALPISRDNLADLRDQASSFEAVGGYTRSFAVLEYEEVGEPALVQAVSGSYFSMLGVPLAMGVPISEAHDEVEGRDLVLVLSNQLWHDRFAADPEVLGKQVRLGGHSFVIIGVAAPEFHGTQIPLQVGAWAPMSAFKLIDPHQATLLGRRGLTHFGLASLREGVTLEQAQTEVDAISARLAAAYVEDNETRRFQLRRLSENSLDPNLRDQAGNVGMMLMGVVGLILLIACANVANLLLARASVRTREVAIRQAIGCGPTRLIRQLLTESMLLALLGGLLGLGVARVGAELILRHIVPLPPTLDVGLDLNVLVFALLVALGTGLLFGLAPAISVARRDLVHALKGLSTQHGSGGVTRMSLGSALVVIQVALSLIALVGSGLFIRSLAQAHAMDPGFDHEHTATMVIGLPRPDMSDAEQLGFRSRMLDTARALPGLEAASIADAGPFGGTMLRTTFIVGHDRGDDGVLIDVNGVGDSYFETVQIPLLEGRAFTVDDDNPDAEVVIINRTMAERFWPEASPVGRQIRFSGSDKLLTVVGVAADIKYYNLGEQPIPYIYTSAYTRVAPQTNLVLRFTGEPEGQLAATQQVLRDAADGAPIFAVATVSEVLDETLWASRAAAILLAVFGALALLLSATGIYGLMSYNVNLRTHEFGVRMALGARPVSLRSMVLRQSMTLVMTGLALGILAALLLSRPIAPMLYEISPSDPLAYLAALVILFEVALAASWFPARRATRVDPMEALRSE
jgi:predicted permease